MTLVYVGLGSNLGDRVATLSAAVVALAATPGVRVVAVSRIYESEPWGVTDQPPFANAVAAIDVDLGPDDLLAAFKRIEAEAGRVAGVRNGPRALDLDLLLFGDFVVSGPNLTVPHPRLLCRDFVVTPLLEIAPGIALPDGTPVTREHACDGRVIGEVSGPLPVPEDTIREGCSPA